MCEQGGEPAERNGCLSHERGLDQARVDGIDGDIGAGESLGEGVGEEQVARLGGTEGVEGVQRVLGLQILESDLRG